MFRKIINKIEDIIVYTVIIGSFLVLIGVVLGGIGQRIAEIDLFSCEKAEKAAQKYLSKYHPGSDYEISSVGYNDKDELYYVSIISPNSVDRNFSLGYDRKGNLTYNSYESLVVEKGNTAIRLSNEYNAAVDAVLEATSPWNDFLCVGGVMWQTSDGNYDEPYYIISDELELDASYDLADLGAQAGSLWIHVDVETAEEATLEELAAILLYVRQTLDEADLPFYHLDCMLHYHNGTSSIRWEVEDFLYEDIYEEGLLDRLENVAVLS